MIFSLWFAVKRIVRRPLVAAGTMLLCAAFTLLLLGVGSYSDSQKNSLDGIYENMAVTCVITNRTGMKSDGLNIIATDYDRFTDPLYPLSRYVKDIMRLKELECLPLESEDEPDMPERSDFKEAETLIAVDSFESADALASYSGTPMSYLDGYSADFLSGSMPCCIVSSTRWDMLEENEDGTRTLLLALYDRENDLLFANPLELTVIGCYFGETNAIYMPFSVCIEAMDGEDMPRSCDSLRFTLNDNYRLDEFIAELRTRFPEPDIGATSAAGWKDYAAMVYDKEFREAVKATERNLSFAGVLIPVLLTLSMVSGALVSMLCVRSGKKSFAVMRSMGTKPGTVFASALAEQLILQLLGTAVGMGAYAAAAELSRTGLVSMAILIVVYALGCAVMTYGTVRINVMKIMKEE